MTKQNPFSLYDFFGYLIPGATLIYLILILKEIDNSSAIDYDNVFSAVSEYKYQEIFIFIIISYALGHILSFISSITIEKYGNWNYGYPSKYLLGFKKNSYFLKKEKPEIVDSNIIYEIESNDKDLRIRNIGRKILLFLLGPLTLVDKFFGEQLYFKNFYQKGLDSYLTNSIKIKVKRLLDSLNIENFDQENENFKEYDFNRIVSHYSFENCKQHHFRMVNYVAIYGFLRNLALIFILICWIYILKCVFSINIESKIDFSKIFIIISLMLLSYISFMAYMKFYRRYSLEGLMLILVDKNI